MTLIKCDSNCKHQKDGYCTNEDTSPKNISLANIENGCVYFEKDVEYEKRILTSLYL